MPATDAAAATPADECDYLQFCAYTLPNEQGDYQVILKQAGITCVNLEPALQGQISSLTNRTDWFVTLFAGTNCAGASKYVDSGVGYPDLRVQGFDNQLRSIRFDRSYPTQRPCGNEYWSALCMFDGLTFSGEAQVIGERPDDTCVNLQPGFKGRVTSVVNQLPAQDALLFDGDGCTGNSIRIGFGTASRNLAELSFDNVLRSVRLVPVPTPPCGDTDSDVCVYSGYGYTGLTEVVGAGAIGSCVNLPSTIAGVVSSVANHLTDRRAVLYANADCSGDYQRVDPEKAIPDLDWEQFDDKARSVGFTAPPDECEYSFRKLCVYADIEWQGARQSIAPELLTSCVNLQASMQAQVTSMENNTYQEVTFYTGLNCTGKSDWISAGVGYPNLGFFGLDNQVRSVRHTITARKISVYS